MGIRAVEEDDVAQFSELIAANTTIPTTASRTYTTTRDDQTQVNIEIFNGSLAPEAKVGQFRLVDLVPAPAGAPRSR